MIGVPRDQARRRGAIQRCQTVLCGDLDRVRQVGTKRSQSHRLMRFPGSDQFAKLSDTEAHAMRGPAPHHARRTVALDRSVVGEGDALRERPAGFREVSDLDHANASGCDSRIAAITASENLSRISFDVNSMMGEYLSLPLASFIATPSRPTIGFDGGEARGPRSPLSTVTSATIIPDGSSTFANPSR